jgi:hypothetical protein
LSKGGDQDSVNPLNLDTLAAGGRYETIFRSLMKSQGSKAIGVNIAFSKFVALLNEKRESFKQASIVVSCIGNCQNVQIDVCQELWGAGIAAYMSPYILLSQQDEILVTWKQSFTFALLLKQKHTGDVLVKLRHLASKVEIEIPPTDLLKVIQQEISKTHDTKKSLGSLHSFDTKKSLGSLHSFDSLDNLDKDLKKLKAKKQPDKCTWISHRSFYCISGVIQATDYTCGYESNRASKFDAILVA